MPDKDSVILTHGRTPEQEAIMHKILEDGADPFDWELLPTYHKEPILRQGAFWLITPNEFPYEGTRLHLLLIYRDAVESPSETKPEAWMELHEHLSWIEKEFAVRAGGLLMRFGDPELTAASVRHLHAHIIVGGEGRTNEKLKVSVGYRV